MASLCWKRLSSLERGLTVIAFSMALLCIACVIGICVIMSQPKPCDTQTVQLRVGDSPKIYTLEKPKKLCLTPTCIRTASEILNNMDVSVEPCDNFYKFACGKFIEEATIPDDKEGVHVFGTIIDHIQEQLRKVIEAPLKPDKNKFSRLIKVLYKSCMDRKTIAAHQHEPLLTLLKKVGGWPVLEGDNWNEDDFHWIQSVYKFRDVGLSTNYFIGLAIRVDSKNNTRAVIHLDQPSVGLSRELLVGGASPGILAAYHRYMIDIAILLGAKKEAAEKELTEVLEFQKTLARITISNEERRAITRLYNPSNIGGLSHKYPSIPWKEYFNRILAPKITVDDDEMINVNVPGYISKFEKVIKETPKRIQANYVMWRAVSDSISYLSEDLRARQFQFITEAVGTSARQSRWKECIDMVADKLSLGVASLYIRQYFDEASKKNVVEIFQNIKQEMNKVLQWVDFMDIDTRKNALRKISAMRAHIGYPDELLDDQKLDDLYHDLELSDGNYLQSILNVSRYYKEDAISGLREPYNRSDWKYHGNTVRVNAFYIPSENGIDILAAILQGRFFNHEQPQYMNYGGIGFVIGHEITHGFDDSGRYYDKDGNVVNWWSPSSEEKFSHKVECIVSQYGNYTVPEIGLNVDGKITRNENLADNGGTKLAYRAYKKWASLHSEELSLPGLDFTPSQMFWIAMANTFCSKHRKEEMELLIYSDIHSPGEFRVIGSMSNALYFAKDFKCPLGSKMNPKNRCVVW